MTYSDRFTRGWPKGLSVPYGPYRAFVTGVHDGDTITVLIDPGCDLMGEREIRIYGIQSEELTDRDPARRAAALAARDHARLILPTGSPVRITTLLATTGEQSKSFVRFVGQVESDAGGVVPGDFAAEMVASGNAWWCDRNLKPLPGPPPPIDRWIPPRR